jgi:hypothetical protein
MLQYLRKKNLATFVKTCQLVGVNPEAIQA